MQSLWKKVNYRSGTEFLIDSQIYEYDISKANISVLRDANVLSEEQYQYFYNAPKEIRSVAIGKLQGSNTEVTKILKEGIANARKIFQISNGIEDHQILSIRNDSMTIIGNPVNNLQITDRVSFRQTGFFTSYYKINYLDLFYLFDIVTQAESFEIKGMNSSAISLHSNFMLEFLLELCYCAQIEGVKTAIPILQSFYNNYINRLLDIGYYREFNAQSLYRYMVSNNTVALQNMCTDYMTNYDKRFVDIRYNESILRHMNSIFASIYFGKR